MNAATTPTGHTARKESNMDFTNTLATFEATVMASNEADALAKVQKRLVGLDGFEATGAVSVRSAKHLLFSVEVANLGGDANRAWVQLTSYGISPDESLKSYWGSVKGVGC
jgi:hypothetical protein